MPFRSLSKLEDPSLSLSILKEEHIEGCIECIFDSTLKNDPISTSLRITEAEYYECLKLILLNTVNDQISIVVTHISSQKIIACAINTDIKMILGTEVLDEEAQDQNFKIYSKMEKRLDEVFNNKNFKPGEAADAEFYCVRKAYKQTGLSKEIFLESLRLCWKKGFKYYCGTVFQEFVLDLFVLNDFQPVKKIEVNDLPLKGKKFLEYMKNGANIILIDLFEMRHKFVDPLPKL